MKISIFTLPLFGAVVVAQFSNSSYAPYEVACPSDPQLTRPARGLGKQEADWVKGRNLVTTPKLIEFLENANMEDFDASSFINNATKDITIGLAFSGGGYRSMLTGAGQLAALDETYPGATENGLGGLLQASTYITGCSGGAWLVGTFAGHDFTSVSQITDSNAIWDLTFSIIDYGGLNLIKKANYFSGVSNDINQKYLAGYQVSLTDPWSRMLSYQMFADLPNKGAGLTLSSLQTANNFGNYQIPMPIFTASSRAPGTITVDLLQTNYEITPFEFGTWDPSVFQFTNIKYLGTSTVDGKHTGTCVNGYDNTGFLFGTSSTLFNFLVLDVSKTFITGIFATILNNFALGVALLEKDTAVYSPNPFYKSDIGSDSSITDSKGLYLVDGGEDGQNIPLRPLIAPEREVDVIFAYDNSADTLDNWPDGSSMQQTYQRQFTALGNGTSSFPYVPDKKTFRNLGLTGRPTFFGCDAKNLTSLVEDPEAAVDIPLVVYTANRPFSFLSDTSTFQIAYLDYFKNAMIKNGFEVASRNNLAQDSEWAACVGCAIIRREQERNGIEQTDQCKRCFAKYCWDGSLDTSSKLLKFTPDGMANLF